MPTQRSKRTPIPEHHEHEDKSGLEFKHGIEHDVNATRGRGIAVMHEHDPLWIDRGRFKFLIWSHILDHIGPRYAVPVSVVIRDALGDRKSLGENGGRHKRQEPTVVSAVEKSEEWAGNGAGIHFVQVERHRPFGKIAGNFHNPGQQMEVVHDHEIVFVTRKVRYRQSSPHESMEASARRKKNVDGKSYEKIRIADPKKSARRTRGLGAATEDINAVTSRLEPADLFRNPSVAGHW
ncbi:hypothetical protein [Cryobacterium sp. BB736]|uniref:hypothetical protein n=1 Tax=Cryobacterium sp. BB736 TaxID=2746963 RepID=UPI002106F7AA|nr:hypothetical protein [Cryobacterium sp. BB736]